MDEQTAKHLVKIMEDIQKDVHVIASNKEVLNTNFSVTIENGKDGIHDFLTADQLITELKKLRTNDIMTVFKT